ncbi:MAG: leucyl aminopeptidase family protein [Proteobacteria bacterium]|nr:leucyl aminopeptidase family protein [Pseudomonadota bacterium]
MDALLIIVPDAPAASVFDQLPESERWQELNERQKPSKGTVRTTVLSNRRQTLAVLGYIGAEASTFERLSLAGRMFKEVSARNPRDVGLMSLAGAASAEALLAAGFAAAFQMPAYRSKSDNEPGIERFILSGESALDLPQATATARGTNLVRWLTALPPNLLDSRSYRDTIAKLARSHKLGFNWHDEQSLKRAGANAFLAVAAANATRDAGIAHLTYRPKGSNKGSKASKPDIALVGKGILFDTGGVNLKPHRSMLDMHTDMSGSAVALATLLALVELEAPIAVDAWLAITENQIGPTAYRPQEVVTASNGVTIQVIHTDAEGRMVLADTLALACKTQPRFMIDFATLTGAAVYSLTERMSAVLTNREALAPLLVEAGRSSGERVWNFPLDSDFDSDIESKVADVAQCSVESKGDHILATRFLNRFVAEDIAWAHVDLAAATRTGGLGHVNTEITGFGVRYALELILKHNILGAAGLRK